MAALAPGGDAARLWRFGAFELNEASRVLLSQGREVPLETKSFDLLGLLVRRAGDVLSKEEMLSTIWPGRIVSDSVLAKCVVKVRAALGEQGPSLIKTVHGVGYRLDAMATMIAVTAVREAPESATKLAVGAVVSGRESWRLQQRLSDACETWLVQHEKTRERRLFKFALGGAELEALKREVTINRLLINSYPARREFVAISEWNFETRPAWLEMPFLPGGNLAEWLSAQGGAAAVPFERRVELVARAAEVLALAHAVGVVHCDLKPGNLLVEPGGHGPALRLVDFGVSSLTEPERLESLAITRMGLSPPGSSSPAGTLAYLAPEVLAGQPQTVKSDLYALGVLLFQLCAGDLTRALAPGWERRIGDELLREDIAAAADFDPEHRLGDASELARRLRSLESRRAQRAAARAATERLAIVEAQLARDQTRRKWLYGITASLLVGLNASLFLYVYALRERRTAEAALASSQAELLFLNEDVLGAADPLRAGGGRDATIASVLDAAAGGLKQRFVGQPEVASQLAYTIARSYQNLGLHKEGRALLKEQLATLPPASGQALRLRFLLADIDTEIDEYGEAQALLDGLAGVLSSHRRKQDDLATDVRLSRAWLDFELGYFERSRNGFDTIIRDLQARKPVDLDGVRTAQWWMVDSLLDLGRLDEADQLLSQVLTDYHAQYGEANARYLWARMSLGNLRIMQGRYDDAERLLADVQFRITDSLGEGHNIGLYATHLRGVIHLLRGQPAEALPFLEQAYRLRVRYDGGEFHATRLVMNRLGEVYCKLGRVEEGSNLLESAYASSVKQFTLDHPYTLQLAGTLAQARLLSGDLASAAELVETALAHVDARLPKQHLTRGHLQFRLGEVRLAQHRAADARQAFQAAAEVFRVNGAVAAAAMQLAEQAQREVERPSPDWMSQLVQLAI